ncbi:hypothetical protein RI367_002400 [Sorochytrium milnesiophthora]
MQSLVAYLVLSLLSIMSAAQPYGPPPPPKHIGVLLYPGFEALDVFGPLEFFNMLSYSHDLRLSLISTVDSDTLDPVSTRGPPTPDSPKIPRIEQSVVPTHTLDTAPDGLDALLVPGGQGSRTLVNDTRVLDYIRDQAAQADYFLTVCTGSALAAAAGVLDGKNATSNKNAWKWATAQGPNVHWQPRARWVVDGTTWTSSGVSAGMDMTVAFIKQVWGADVAKTVAKIVEYVPIEDPSDDPFAVQLA